MSTTNTHQDLVMTRVFNAPLEQVWNAWINPEIVKQWWGPNGFSCPSARIDFREGATSLVCMRAPQEFGGQDNYNVWAYTTITPMTLIDFVQSFADQDGALIDPSLIGLPADTPRDVRTRLTFKALDAQTTELTVTEYGWPEGHMREMSRMGMEQCLDKMAAALTRS